VKRFSFSLARGPLTGGAHTNPLPSLPLSFA
jgi:hypothetical protein